MKRRDRASKVDFESAAASITEDYNDFVTRLGANPSAAEVKEFTLKHAAARSALNHLEHLLKMAPDAGDAAKTAARMAALEAARNEIEALPDALDDGDE